MISKEMVSNYKLSFWSNTSEPQQGLEQNQLHNVMQQYFSIKTQSHKQEHVNSSKSCEWFIDSTGKQNRGF